MKFQSALRFAVVSDGGSCADLDPWFQSALRFAVVSDALGGSTDLLLTFVSIRFEVRGGFRRVHRDGHHHRWWFQSALRFAVVSDGVSLAITASGDGFNPL